MNESVVILGAGGIGSAAARFLAQDGRRVTVLERFAFDHDRGSSYGASRIIRRVYPDRFYTGLMDAAYPLWEALERDAEEALLLRTGGLFFGPADSADMAAVRDALKANNVPCDVMDAAETRRRFPAFRLRPDEIGVYQEDGGILRASACVRANLRLAAAHGAVLREETHVERIDLRPDSIHISIAGGEALEADRLIVAAGPWMGAILLPFLDLPLAVTRQTYCHFVPERDSESFTIGRFPVWIDFGTNFYGFPHHDGAPGVKVAWHAQGDRADAETVDREVREADREPLRRYCSDRLPDLSGRIALEKVCLYTNTPDDDFIVDRLPDDPRVVIVGGGSGHAFKFTTLLGQIAAWMAVDRPAPWDLGRFALSRFDEPPCAGPLASPSGPPERGD